MITKCAQDNGWEIADYYDENDMAPFKGVINESHFLSFRKQYDAELETLKAKKQELQDELASTEIGEKDTSRFLAIIGKYTDLKELDGAVAHELIDRIYIGKRIGAGKDLKQGIHIVYKFVGEVARQEMMV